jgi:hypothetical protein
MKHTGTKDFVDGAVELLKQGKHTFLIVAIDPTGKDTANYMIRVGCTTKKNIRRLYDIVSTVVVDDLERIADEST